MTAMLQASSDWPAKRALLEDLDLHFAGLQGQVQQLAATFPPLLPTISFGTVDPKVLAEERAKLARLEQSFKTRYPQDLEDTGWHGRTSLQRLFWQDDEFLATLTDPLAIKLMLARAKDGQEPALGASGMTLSSALLYGLAANRLSYLVSATPNWLQAPLEPGVAWDGLLDMQVPIARELPRSVTLVRLEATAKGLQTVAAVLAESLGSAPARPAPGGTPLLDQAVSAGLAKVNGASLTLLHQAFNLLINTPQRASILLLSAAGASTERVRMAGQCFEVMARYPELVQAQGGDQAKALGYGLVSHALDARHLAAALFALAAPQGQPGTGMDPLDRRAQLTEARLLGLKTEPLKPIELERERRRLLRELDQIKEERQRAAYLGSGQAATRTLLADAQAGRLDPEVEFLLTIRFRQLASLVLGMAQPLGLTAEELARAFRDPAAQAPQPPAE